MLKEKTKRMAEKVLDSDLREQSNDCEVGGTIKAVVALGNLTSAEDLWVKSQN